MKSSWDGMGAGERKRLAEHWIGELENPVKSLSAWEEGFLASVSDQLQHRGSLTENQMEKLEAIYAEKTA